MPETSVDSEFRQVFVQLLTRERLRVFDSILKVRVIGVGAWAAMAFYFGSQGKAGYEVQSHYLLPYWGLAFVAFFACRYWPSLLWGEPTSPTTAPPV